MQSLNLDILANIIEGSLLGNDKQTVDAVATDSRLVTRTDGVVFFALETIKNDGHRYIPELAHKGVKSFVVTQVPDIKGVNFIVVDDTLEALQKLAQHKRESLKGKVIGITGSNGKTIVKEWLFQILSHKKTVYRSPRSYNSQLGVAISLINADAEADFVIIEAGISQIGEMERLTTMIKPDIAILTNIGEVHQQNFTSLEEKAKEKLKLVHWARTRIVQADCYSVQLALGHDFSGFKAWSYKSSYGASVALERISDNNTRITFKGRVNQQIEVPFTDKASLENAISVFYLLSACVSDLENYVDYFSNLEPVAMRMELKKGINGSLIINDSYNSDLGSLEIALDFLLQQTNKGQLKRRVILSDIVQSGREAVDLYRKVNELLESKGVEHLIGVGESISEFSACFTLNADFYASTNDLLNHISQYNFRNEGILIKGARRFSFERIADHLSYKMHKTTLEINLNALTDNVSWFRKKLKPETKVMAMVKAFAYGAGSYEIARHLQYHGVDYLAVAVADEGVELRREGVTLPIMVLSPDIENLQSLFQYELEPEVHSLKVLYAIHDAAANRGIDNFPIHIKLDTGMHRLGFTGNDMEEITELLSQEAPVLKVVSVFSHLSSADDPDLDWFTQEQFKRFEELSGKIMDALTYKPMRHILNSAGCERFSEYQFDMVRLGIGMYGVSCTGSEKLTPVSTFKTRITQIRKLAKNEAVGYGRRGVLKRNSSIAVLPVGYADGLARLCGNGKGYAYVGSRKAQYIGNICMDMSMIDVTGLDVHEGDEVIIFGNTPDINELATWMQTIPYEVITSISQRVRRVFVKE